MPPCMQRWYFDLVVVWELASSLECRQHFYVIPSARPQTVHHPLLPLLPLLSFSFDPLRFFPLLSAKRHKRFRTNRNADERTWKSQVFGSKDIATRSVTSSRVKKFEYFKPFRVYIRGGGGGQESLWNGEKATSRCILFYPRPVISFACNLNFPSLSSLSAK